MLTKKAFLPIIDNIIFICLIIYSLTFLFHFHNFLSIAFYFALLKYIIYRPHITISSKHFYFILLFLFSTFLSIFLNDTSSISTFYLKEYSSRFLTPLAGLLIIFSFKITEKKFITLLTCFSFTLSINSLFVIYQFLNGNTARPTGLVEPSNYMLLCIELLILPIIFTFLLNKKDLTTKLKNFFTISILLNTLSIIFQNTRIIWIGIFFSFLLILFFSIKSYKKIFIYISFTIICLFTIFHLNPTSLEEFHSIYNMSYSNQSNSERLLMWQSSINMFIEHPFFGIGIGNFHQEYVNHYHLPEAREMTFHPHNNFLFILIETGILGIISYLIFIFYFYYNTLKTWFNTKNTISLSYLSILISYTINNFTDSVFCSNSVEKLTYMFWFITGIYLVLNKFIVISFNNSNK